MLETHFKILDDITLYFFLKMRIVLEDGCLNRFDFGRKLRNMLLPIVWKSRGSVILKYSIIIFKGSHVFLHR